MGYIIIKKLKLNNFQRTQFITEISPSCPRISRMAEPIEMGHVSFDSGTKEECY